MRISWECVRQDLAESVIVTFSRAGNAGDHAARAGVAGARSLAVV